LRRTWMTLWAEFFPPIVANGMTAAGALPPLKKRPLIERKRPRRAGPRL